MKMSCQKNLIQANIGQNAQMLSKAFVIKATVVHAGKLFKHFIYLFIKNNFFRAFSATGAISDRICIHSKGQQKVFISAQDLDTCCSFECNNILGNCQGGDPLGGHRYYLEFGIVTGGLYKSNEGCIPYSLPNCSHHVHGSLPSCDTVKITVPTCTSQCEPSYKTPYHQDSHRGKEVYVLKSEQQIMADVIQNGPVSVAYTVFEDFEVYKEGIYRHVTGKQVGGHAVRLVGWGVENGVKYWKLANSWNAEWGEKGYFRMLRGVDECGIESQRVVASLPRL